VEKLIGDADANVRREAVLAAGETSARAEAGICRDRLRFARSAAAGHRGSLAAAWTTDDAAKIAKSLPRRRRNAKAEAAVALGRLKATTQAPAVLADVERRRAGARRGRSRVRRHREAGEFRRCRRCCEIRIRPSAAKRSSRRENSTGDITRKPTRCRCWRRRSDRARSGRTRADADRHVEALAAIAAQLDVDYAPLHEARATGAERSGERCHSPATISLAAEMLATRTRAGARMLRSFSADCAATPRSIVTSRC
jgi:hypothetical protein